MNNYNKQKGAASIFVIIFAALTMSLIVASFAVVMIQHLRSAVDNDLSQRAYDAAIAGVEDAKLALLRNSVSNTNCRQTEKVAKFADNNGNIERAVGSSDFSDNMAYTCVNIIEDTTTVEKEITAEKGGYIKIKARGDVQYVTVRWMLRKDYNLSSASGDLVLLSKGNNPLQYETSSSSVVATTMRIQYIKAADVSGKTNVNNYAGANAHKWNNTIFARPSGLVNRVDWERSFPVVTAANGDLYASIYNSQSLVGCWKPRFDSDQFGCGVNIKLPEVLKAGEVAYLRLNSIYPEASKTSVQIGILDSSKNAVKFSGIQPIVDSTGRASDVFRRVVARVEPVSSGDVIVPNNAVEINGNDKGLCKNFSISGGSYEQNGPSCF